MKRLFSVFLSVCAVAAQADLELSGIAAGKSSPGAAELVATVSGTGDVFAEYAPAKNASYRSVRDRYVKEGLLAMWDAVDNMGTGGCGALASGARYVRFLSVQDGWSASVYLPQTPVVRGCVVIVR